MFRRMLLAALVLSLPALPAAALEIGLADVSLSGGMIHNIESAESFPGVIIPEAQAGGPFLSPRLRWGVSWTYWKSFKSAPDQTNWTYFTVGSRGVTYSHSSHITGVRLVFLAPRHPRNPATLGLFAGISRHFIRDHFNRLTASGWGTDSAWGTAFTTFDYGATATSPIRGPFSLRIEVRMHRPIYPKEDIVHVNRIAATVGLMYSFHTKVCLSTRYHTCGDEFSNPEKTELTPLTPSLGREDVQ